MSNPFVGSWKLISAVYERDGQTAFPFGADPVGLLIYNDLGHMSVQIMQRNRTTDEARPPQQENGRAAFAGYLGYFGRYEIRADEGTVMHHVAGSTLPHWVGGVQVRNYEFSGRQLTLSAPATRKGQGAMAILVWERLGQV